MYYSPMFETKGTMIFGPAKSEGMFNDFFNASLKNVEMPVEAFSNNDNYVIKYYLANVNKEDISISVKDNDSIVVSFIRVQPDPKPCMSDLKYGDIESTIKLKLDNRLKEEDVSAVHENGLLTITVNKNKNSSSKISIK